MLTEILENKVLPQPAYTILGTCVVFAFSIIVFTAIYFSFFDSPNIEEYKEYSRSGTKMFLFFYPVVYFKVKKELNKTVEKQIQ